MSNLKNLIKTKINQKLKKKVDKKNFKDTLKFSTLSIIVNAGLAIILNMNEIMINIIDNSYSSLNSSNGLLFFSFISLSTVFLTSLMFLCRSKKIKKYFDEENYSALLNDYDFEEEFKYNKMTLEEINNFFEIIKKESKFSDEELALIIRNIKNEESLEIGNELFMLKILSNVIKQEDLRDNIDINHKIKQQMKIFIKEKLKEEI